MPSIHRRARSAAGICILAGLCVAISAMAADLDGLELGAEADEIRQQLAGAGELREMQGPLGRQIAAGHYVIDLCGEEVFAIRRTLAPTSTAWIRAVKHEADRRGRARAMAATVSDDQGVSRMTVEWSAGRGSTLSLVMENSETGPPQVYRRLSTDAPCRAPG